jgi:hypothetical protein
MEQRQEYTKILQTVLTPHFARYILGVVEKSGTVSLTKIPSWSEEEIFRFEKQIRNEANCAFLQELIDANVKAYSLFLSGNPQFQVPQNTSFVLYRILQQAAKDVYYFVLERKNNGIKQSDLETLIQNAIVHGLYRSLPLKKITTEYLKGPQSESMPSESYEVFKA